MKLQACIGTLLRKIVTGRKLSEGDVACGGHAGGVRDGKGHIQRACNALSQKSLPVPVGPKSKMLLFEISTSVL